jgi:hypothetical protein
MRIKQVIVVEVALEAARASRSGRHRSALKVEEGSHAAGSGTKKNLKGMDELDFVGWNNGDWNGVFAHLPHGRCGCGLEGPGSHQRY